MEKSNIVKWQANNTTTTPIKVMVCNRCTTSQFHLSENGYIYCSECKINVKGWGFSRIGYSE